METTRIKVRIGADEFEAEGPHDLVTKQFDSFMSVVSVKPKETPAPAAPVSPAIPVGGTILPPLITGVPQSTLERVFRQGDILSLAALPNGESAPSDAMLAILYGYWKIKNETTVTGTSLMKSAKLSGVPIDRVDRLIAVSQPDYVLAAGVRKARRYQLNNRGIVRAEEIINGILQ